ncbi:hypothetical protein [Streptomyces sp. NPDC047130]|uniref:hypothetical protein n=1 Tax=Streptomyces sp. NPDC047130 TaxID=3155261 RepID=UPI0033C46CD5
MTFPAAGLPVSLPGFRLWLGRLVNDLRGGRSCLLLLPSSLLDGPEPVSERLLDELLHELDEFVLLPPADGDVHTPDAAPATPPVPAPRTAPDATLWSGLAPVLDYDDGLGGLFTSVPSSGAVTRSQPTRAPTEAEALADLLERLAKELHFGQGTVGDDDTAGDVLLRLVKGPTGVPETRPVVVRGWREPAPTATGHLLRRVVAVAKEAGLPPGSRPRALVLATTRDLPPGLPGQLAREDVAVHWWWGVTGRLDTATVVALSRPPLDSSLEQNQLYEAVAQATITEICGPFLSVAASLAVRWEDGRPETLPAALREAVADHPVPERSEANASDATRVSGPRPDEALLPAWNLSAVDSWDGRLRRYPDHCLESRHAMESHVWLAQSHVLLPLVDASRERFATVVRANARIPLQRLAEQYGPRRDLDDGQVPTSTLIDTMELGAMWGAYRDGAIVLSPQDRRHLRILRAARNHLAHRTPLSGDELRRLIAELCR